MNEADYEFCRGALYSAAQIRELEQRAIASQGIPGYALMQSAGAAAWRALRDRWPAADSVAVVCGPGNNGGDGFELARLAAASGFRVRLFEPLGPAATGDAVIARRAWLDAGGKIDSGEFDSMRLLAGERSCVVVDALFGIGLKRAPEGRAEAAILAINSAHDAGASVLAIDIPSGLFSDDGRVFGACVRADLSVTFIGDKLGFYLGEGAAVTGGIVLDRIGLPAQLYQGVEPALVLLGEQDLRRACPRRARDSHKGSNGHVLLIGGDLGTPGAILLAARGALRAGAGLVSVATRAEHAAALAAAQPEVMFRGIADARDLKPMLARADVVAIGPGLGMGDWGDALWNAVRKHDKLIVDADALNRLAQAPERSEAWVLTPHPGEAARLLGIATRDVQADRVAAVQALQARYAGVAVLKGAGTLIGGAPPAPIKLCRFGNPGMGSGGMGDVLSGVIAAMQAQGLAAIEAAACGVLAHALAGDLAARQGERGLIPSDLIEALRAVVNPCP